MQEAEEEPADITPASYPDLFSLAAITPADTGLVAGAANAISCPPAEPAPPGLEQGACSPLVMFWCACHSLRP